MENIEEWPNFPDDYLESRKHDIHVHIQILKREIDEVHEYLAHYQEPWISEGQLRKAVEIWKREDPLSWRSVEELETQNTIEAMKSPAYKQDDLKSTMLHTVQTAVEDHHMQKTSRTRHIGLGRTMSSSANKNHKNQDSSVPRSLSLKKQSISDITAGFKTHISQDAIKGQFAKHDFVYKTHYKPPEILSPGKRRSNTSLSPKITSGEKGKTSLGYSRRSIEQLSSARTTFIPSATVTPGERISDTIKTQFASMSAHYKEPDVLSPSRSRSSSIISRSPHVSPEMEQNSRFSPYISGSTTSSPRHAPIDQGSFGTYQKVDDAFSFSKAWHNSNDRANPGLGRLNTTNDPSNIYDQDRANLAPAHSNALAQRSSDNQMARRTPEVLQEASYDRSRGATPTLARKSSFDQISRETPTIPSISLGINGSYHLNRNKSPESQANHTKFPSRSSSLARRTLGSNTQNLTTPSDTKYLRPRPPPLPQGIVSHKSHTHNTSKPQSPDYIQYGNYDMRSQYSQSKYSQYPSQIQRNTDFENFGLDAYPASPVPPMPVFDYNNTTKSNISSSSVPIAMYPTTPDAVTTSTFAQPLPSANHHQASTNLNQSRSSDSKLHIDQTQNIYVSSQNEYNGSMYKESQYPDNRVYIRDEGQDQDMLQEHQHGQSPSSIASQRAAHRITVWDGSQGFTDPGFMPIIEESPGELKREKQREQRVAEEKFDFSSFWSDLTRI